MESAQGAAALFGRARPGPQCQLTRAICVHLDAQDTDVGAPDAHAHPVSALGGGQAKLLNGVDAHDGDPVPGDDLVTQVPVRTMGRKGKADESLVETDSSSRDPAQHFSQRPQKLSGPQTAPSPHAQKTGLSPLITAHPRLG